MKTDVPTSKQPKTGRVTLREARAAVRAVKGDRPRGKFVTVSASRLEDLRDKYLGLILHGASASAGFSWAADCSKAFDRWHETHPTADQLANSPPDEPSPKPPSIANPSNDPRLASSYWCSDRDGACPRTRRVCRVINNLLSSSCIRSLDALRCRNAATPLPHRCDPMEGTT